MSPIRISINAAEFTSKLNRLGLEQAPFAIALALTRCANDSVADEKATLTSKFIVRNNWMAKGFRVDNAKKSALVATVRHLDAFMKLQEEGGVKSPLSASDVAIPVGARPSPTALTPQSKWPGKLARHFYITKGNQVLEFQRVGRRSRGKHKKEGSGAPDPNIKLMYVFRKSVPIRARLGLTEICRKHLREDFGTNFMGFLAYAIRTSKR